MGDSRYGHHLERLKGSDHPDWEVRSLHDDDVVAALAAASRERDAYLANVLATEALNRLRRARGDPGPRRGAEAEMELAVAPHDHLCLVYASTEDQLAAVVPYVKDGLEKGERCIYVADDRTVSEIDAALVRAGIDVAAAERSGSLVMASKTDAYIRDGGFDPDRMLGYLAEAALEARDRGFAALRVTGEMTWALGSEPGTERVLEYEAKLNGFFARYNASAICQYNLNRFPAELLLGVLRTHPKVLHRGLLCDNPFYIPAEEYLGTADARRSLDRLLDRIVSGRESEMERRSEALALEGLVRTRTRDLLEVNRSLEAFAAAVSHDIRAPLRGVAQLLEVLEEDHGNALGEEGAALVGRARKESRRLVTLVNDLLALSRSVSSPVSLAQVDVSQVAREVASDLREWMPDHDVDVSIEEGLVAEADGRVLRVVLRNLLGNAWKFTKGVGNPRVEVFAERDGDGTVFVVRDNGVGFDPSEAPALFEPFRRLANARHVEGSGLGLSTVRRLVERQGGRVWIEGRPGAGATVRFTIGSPSRMHGVGAARAPQ
ncbi:MAG TPA: MEDS domain-containing protein [Candidatus Thermoplasmatota archaeon]|nr:MEDS domain-containing protein [Candidatus Thermoplasmatota archaeon]